MKTAFVRALWGDRLIPRSVVKIRADVTEALNQPLQIPFVTYSFGRENTELLRSCGIDARQISECGIVNFFGAKRRSPSPRPRFVKGRYEGPSPIYNWGVSMWRHKLVAIAAALEEFDQVVWLDWDCRLLKRLPVDFWRRIGQGAEVQSSLRQYRRVKCPWRSTGRRIVPGGAFLAVRGRKAIERLLSIQQEHPTWDDEVTAAYHADWLQGGWRGEAAYVAAGFEPYCYLIRGQIFRPKVPLFTAK